MTFSSNLVIPYQGVCSQFLISSNKFYTSGTRSSASNPGACGFVQALLGTCQEARAACAGGYRQSLRAESSVRGRSRRGRSATSPVVSTGLRASGKDRCSGVQQNWPGHEEPVEAPREDVHLGNDEDEDAMEKVCTQSKNESQESYESTETRT